MKTIIVTGITRSGTSLTMQMLEKGGYPCTGEFPAYEEYGVGEIPFWKLNGTAIKVIDLHMQYPPTGDYYVIRLRRNTAEQSKSIVKFLGTLQNIYISGSGRKIIEKSLADDYKKIDDWARRQKGCITIDFENLIEQPLQTALQIKEFIDFPLDENKMAACVVPRSTKCYDGFIEAQLIESTTSL